MNRVCVIGIAGTSVFLRVPRFHAGGETVHADTFHMEYGGKGFNQAVAAARWGAEVSFFSAVGEADLKPIQSVLEKEKIECLFKPTQEPSAYAAILTAPSGETHVTVYPGGQLHARDVHVVEPAIARADILLLTNEVPEEVNERAVELAAKYGTKVILNPAPSRPLSVALMRGVWLFTPNAFETAGLANQRNVVETRGSEGCFVRETGRLVPAVKAGAVVDTTGAGDTFNGVLAAELARGAELEDACLAANTAAGVSVTKHYVLSAIPNRKQ